MSRTPLNYTTLLSNASITDPPGEPINAGGGNGHRIARALPEQTILRVTNTHTEDHPVTVLAGRYPPALAAGQNSLTVTVPAGGAVLIGPLESGRFIQGDGALLVDVPDDTHTGAITALAVPAVA